MRRRQHESESGADPDILVLNDQGGGIMNVSDKASTLRAQMKHHEPIVCMAVKTKQIDMRTSDETAHPLDGNDDKEPQAVCYAIDQQGGKSNCGFAKDVVVTLCSDSHGTPHGVCYSADFRNGVLNRNNIRIHVGGVLASSCRNAEVTDGRISPTIMARAGTGGNQLPMVAYRIEKNGSCIDRPEPDGREVHDEP